VIKWEDKEALLSTIRKFPDVFAEGFQAILIAVVEVANSKASELAPVGGGGGPGGHLANSFGHGEPYPTTTGWAIDFGTPVEYGEVIENGRSPGSTPPPIREIAQWIWETRYRFPSVKTEDDAIALAYPIARSIGKKGFSTAPDGPGKGWGMLAKGSAYAEGKADKIIEDGKTWIDQEITRLLNG